MSQSSIRCLFLSLASCAPLTAARFFRATFWRAFRISLIYNQIVRVYHLKITLDSSFSFTTRRLAEAAPLSRFLSLARRCRRLNIVATVFSYWLRVTDVASAKSPAAFFLAIGFWGKDIEERWCHPVLPSVWIWMEDFSQEISEFWACWNAEFVVPASPRSHLDWHPVQGAGDLQKFNFRLELWQLTVA